jgi:hypothetical protein
MFNRETHKSRGFGFVVFELEEGAIRVCSEKEHVIDGKLVSFNCCLFQHSELTALIYHETGGS